MNFNNLIKLFYISILLFPIPVAICTPIYTYYYGQLFKPNVLAIFSILGSIVTIFQFLMNRVSIKTSLIITPLTYCLFTLIKILTLYLFEIKVLIYVIIFITPISCMINLHCNGVIFEIFKKKLEMQKITNNTLSLSSLSGVVGYSFSSILTTHYKYDFILLCTYLSSILLSIYDVIFFYYILKFYNENLRGQ